MPEYYHSRTASQRGVWIRGLSPDFPRRRNECRARTSPQGLLESLAWIPLAFSAGFCEELAFRGYLQKQFQDIVGSSALAVLFQAILFGVGHLYEGVGAAARITLFGVLFGLLGVWARACGQGMIAHA